MTVRRKENDYFFEIGHNEWVGVIPETIGQFIGLKDRTGRGMFDGDMCERKGHSELYQIVFYKNAWAIKSETDRAIWHQEFCNGAWASELMVVATIHDK